MTKDTQLILAKLDELISLLTTVKSKTDKIKDDKVVVNKLKGGKGITK